MDMIKHDTAQTFLKSQYSESTEEKFQGGRVDGRQLLPAPFQNQFVNGLYINIFKVTYN